MIGAVLAQNTSWKNVEKAMARIRGRTVDEILKDSKLGDKIRPAGFYVQKERYLREVLLYWKSRVESLSIPFDTREELLGLRGVGKETADSIALYAFHQRTIPIDSYTLRLFNRYFGTTYSIRDYEEIRSVLKGVFNQEMLMEIHGLIDEHSKRVCRKMPRCSSCPISDTCKKNY